MKAFFIENDSFVFSFHFIDKKVVLLGIGANTITFLECGAYEFVLLKYKKIGYILQNNFS